MIIDRQQHWQFLEDELKAQTEDFNNTFATKAISLLKHSEEMFVAQFIKIKDGELIMKFPNTRSLPRKGDFLLCMVLPPKLQDYRNWGQQTYRDLYKQRYKSTEAVCLWHMPTDDPHFTLVGFGKISLEFAEYIQHTPGIILVFAPQRPPIDYFINLQKIVLDIHNPRTSDVLNIDYSPHNWMPVLISKSNVAAFISDQLALTEDLILQGPPGTGKTYMIAELCALLCNKGYSVMVTSMTNRALMEIAQKPALKALLNNKKIQKTNITTDEYKELPQLVPIKEIASKKGEVLLSTFYISSGFAADLTIDSPFDYVIMDEASQAILAMFAACKKIGRKNLWVGDVHQLSPIALLNRDIVDDFKYQILIDGLKTVTDNTSSPIYQLTSTYRFSKRTADYTGIFYKGSLVSKNNGTQREIPALKNLLSKDGGPTLLLTDMSCGDYTPAFAATLTSFIVNEILNFDSHIEVAILSCMRKTVRFLQKTLNQNIGSYTNVLIDTVARVQGLTTDITVFFIPNTSYIRTLEARLFNVATSRAREHCIIIADKNILTYPTISPIVRHYIERLKTDRSIYIPIPKKSNKTPGIEIFHSNLSTTDDLKIKNLT